MERCQDESLWDVSSYNDTPHSQQQIACAEDIVPYVLQKKEFWMGQ